mmetsp:Transcript_3121/g.5558  ORF Transcript_3121/g.5558 Transcript_3121/m.5558 type:complete len:211 (+) Transcript_3121:655-1287(+)
MQKAGARGPLLPSRALPSVTTTRPTTQTTTSETAPVKVDESRTGSLHTMSIESLGSDTVRESIAESSSQSDMSLNGKDTMLDRGESAAPRLTGSITTSTERLQEEILRGHSCSGESLVSAHHEPANDDAPERKHLLGINALIAQMLSDHGGSRSTRESTRKQLQEIRSIVADLLREENSKDASGPGPGPEHRAAYVEDHILPAPPPLQIE